MSRVRFGCRFCSLRFSFTTKTAAFAAYRAHLRREHVGTLKRGIGLDALERAHAARFVHKGQLRSPGDGAE